MFIASFKKSEHCTCFTTFKSFFCTKEYKAGSLPEITIVKHRSVCETTRKKSLK